LAQQALLVENAKKHQHRPEFVADVVRTVDYGVQRMRRLLQQLEQRAAPKHEQRIELGALVDRTVGACRADSTTCLVFTATAPLWVEAEPDRLGSVITHVIVNAQQASAPGGTVEISVSEQEGMATVEVRDEGEGMSEEFIRKRLFKPFDTTKGTSGMGIGVYQAREILRGLGGDLLVQSKPGAGTTVRVRLPLAQSTQERRGGASSVGLR
jgi:putative PEP-CTERM system histidine kinase